MNRPVETKGADGRFELLAAIMHCPKCGAQHVDEGGFSARPHHTHLCAACGFTWRVEPYCVGVRGPNIDLRTKRAAVETDRKIVELALIGGLNHLADPVRGAARRILDDSVRLEAALASIATKDPFKNANGDDYGHCRWCGADRGENHDYWWTGAADVHFEHDKCWWVIARKALGLEHDELKLREEPKP